MANLTAEDIARYKDPEFEAGIAALPPAYIEGFGPTLQVNLTVSIGAGITSVQGRRVERETYVLRKADWHDAYTGGSAGITYYVYLTRDGEYKVSVVRPQYSNALYYFAHPAYDWRVILRLWVDSDDSIKFVSREFRDVPRTVTVAPYGYVGEADYKCDGVNDEVWIKAAIEYAERVELLTGNFEIANSISITKSDWELVGSGAVIKPTAAIALSSASNITIMKLKTLAQSSYKNLFTATSVNSLTVDACTFEMNTGFTATSCNFMSVRNNAFKGVANYIGGKLTFTSCSVLSISNNSFQYYGTAGANTYSISCDVSGGSIVDNTFYDSAGMLLDASSDVAFSLSGNNVENPILFWDEGDATYGPGAAYGSNTETA